MLSLCAITYSHQPIPHDAPQGLSFLRIIHFILLRFWIPRLGSCPSPPEWRPFSPHLGCSSLWMPPLAHLGWLFLAWTIFLHAPGPDTSHQAASLLGQAQHILLGQPAHTVFTHSLGSAPHSRALHSLPCRCWCLPSSVPSDRLRTELFSKDREVKGKGRRGGRRKMEKYLGKKLIFTNQTLCKYVHKLITMLDPWILWEVSF